MPPEYESIKIEVESEDEGEINEKKGKLKEELARMQASLLEKEHMIEKLQQTSSNNVCHPSLSLSFLCTSLSSFLSTPSLLTLRSL